MNLFKRQALAPVVKPTVLAQIKEKPQFIEMSDDSDEELEIEMEPLLVKSATEAIVEPSVDVEITEEKVKIQDSGE